MSYADFEKYWLEIHGAFAQKVPHYLWYAQRHFPAPADGGCATGEFGIDGIAEFIYESAAERDKAWTTPEGRAAYDDVKNVFSRVQEFTFEETVLMDRRS
ncbi:MAG: EthD family reductase [Gammaproteobacteria bacterium]|nr:EthD family reductase [Gammaproteobacteria bacterium]